MMKKKRKIIQLVSGKESFWKEIEGPNFKLRRISRKMINEIESEHVVAKTDRWGKDYIDRDENRESITDDMIDYMILDWNEDVCDMEGNSLPCTRENKLKLPDTIQLKILDICQKPNIPSSEKKTETPLSTGASTIQKST